MRKIIVFSGHGVWDPSGKGSKLKGKKPFATLPGKCSMHFYTSNFTLLKNSSGQQLEQGNFSGVKPEQTAGPYQQVPNMVLAWPSGLNVANPPQDWLAFKYSIADDTKIPVEKKNMQFQIQKPTKGSGGLVSNPYGRLHLDDLFETLRPAILAAKSVLFVWAACRQVNLKGTAHKAGKFQFRSINTINKICYDDLYEEVEEFLDGLDKFDPAIGPQVRVWMNQEITMEKESFMAHFKVPEKLQNITSPQKRAETESAWNEVWDKLQKEYILGRPGVYPLRKELEALKLSKRSDQLKFKKLV